jgi:hypothetical protein|tara:strand:+ start:398 stop:688 length:291 start_codon:yes stop_codon:yes gene_type:complete
MITEYASINELFSASCKIIMGIRNQKPLDLAIIKGEGWAYYMSDYEKRIIPVKKGSSWYVISYEPNEKGDIRLFSPTKLFYGKVIWVPFEHLKIIG